MEDDSKNDCLAPLDLMKVTICEMSHINPVDRMAWSDFVDDAKRGEQELINKLDCASQLYPLPSGGLFRVKEHADWKQVN